MFLLVSFMQVTFMLTSWYNSWLFIILPELLFVFSFLLWRILNSKILFCLCSFWCPSCWLLDLIFDYFLYILNIYLCSYFYFEESSTAKIIFCLLVFLLVSLLYNSWLFIILPELLFVFIFLLWRIINSKNSFLLSCVPTGILHVDFLI